MDEHARHEQHPAPQHLPYPATRYGAAPGTVARMDLLFSVAKPWAYWIAPLLVLVSVLAILMFILNYVFKVVAAKYPKT